jgi:cadmium resistance protein CadD (predicted permease)
MTSVTISTFANVGTDLLIILLPLLVLKQLNFQRAQVAVYAFVLAIGSVSILAALVRYGALRAVWGEPKAEITHTIVGYYQELKVVPWLM